MYRLPSSGRAGLILIAALMCIAPGFSIAQTVKSASTEGDFNETELPHEITVRDAREIGREVESYLVQVPPKYPPLAKRFGIEGKIDAAVLVNREGRPLKVTITRREPYYTDVFDASVRRALMQSKYHRNLPEDGKKAAWFRAPIRFVLEPDANHIPPQVVQLATPEFPPQALEQGLEGWVALAVSVDAKGRPDMERTHVLGRSPAYFTPFDAQARDAVQRSEFKPATYSGTPGYGGLLLRVDFKIPVE